MKRSLVVASALAAAFSSAQVVLSGPGTYSQNFDSLASTGSALTWNDNLPAASMPGWYSNQSTFTADNGSISVSGQYSYGATGSTERALGSTALPGALIVYGLRLNNASGNTFSALNLSYTGEQWRDGSVISDQLIFEYSTNASSLSSGTWTPLTGLNFSSVSNSGAGVLNGNAPANQSFQSGTMSSLNWQTGNDMWVRWTHIGNQSNHALALDNMQLNAVPVPEPAALAGLLVGAVTYLRMRKKV